MSRPAVLAVAALVLAAPRAGAQPCARCTAVAYTVTVSPADSTHLAVEMRVHRPPRPLRLAFAADVEYPGRFAESLTDLHAFDGAGTGTREIPATRDTADLWHLSPSGADVVVRYRVAVEPSDSRGSWTSAVRARGAFVRTHSTYLYVMGAERAPVTLRLVAPAEWTVATALDTGADARTFAAPSFAALLDAPLLAGRLRRWRFDAGGARHDVVYWPLSDSVTFDTARFVRGVEGIAHATLDVFGGRAPYQRYTFLYQDGAWGALEHASSVSLGATAAELRADPDTAIFGTAHEFFHAWNLVRLHPRGWGAVSPRVPAPTGELWWSEGVTIYYAHALLLRAGLASDSLTRAGLGDDLGRWLYNRGNVRVSPERASRTNGDPRLNDGYSPDHYVQGTALALALDAIVRDATDGRRSLDDAMRLLYARRANVPAGFSGVDVERAVGETCGCAVHDFFERHVRAAGALDLAPLLARVGQRLVVARDTVRDSTGAASADLRIRVRPAPAGPPTIAILDPETSWWRAGLRVGDAVRAVNGTAVRDWPSFRAAVAGSRVGDVVTVDYTRDGRHATARVTVAGYTHVRATITPDPAASPRARRLGARWLLPAAR